MSAPTAREMAPRVLPVGWREISPPAVMLELGAVAFAHRSGLRAFMTVEDRGDETGLWWHLSASFAKRTPTWDEMVDVKETLMGAEVLAIQLMPPRSCYLNAHPHTLHVWVRLDADTIPPKLYRQG